MGMDTITLLVHPTLGVAQWQPTSGRVILVSMVNFPMTVAWTGVLDNMADVQVVAVWHPMASTDALYVNGALLATGILWNDMTDPVAYQHNGSIINYQLHGGLTNYIGQLLYTGDPGLLANIDEFRIYNGPLTAAQVAADNALGPNQLRGASTNVHLGAKVSGDPSAVLSWPTTSALVTVMSSPVLGPGAVWTPVNTSGLVVSGGNYQLTVPATGKRVLPLATIMGKVSGRRLRPC